MKKSLIIIALLMLVALLGGCINLQVNTTVNEDGSGTYEIGFYFDDSSMAMFGPMMEGLGGGEGMEGMEGLDMGLDANSAVDLPLGEGETFTDEASGISATGEARDIDGQQWAFVVVNVPNAEAWLALPDVLDRIDTSSEEDMSEDTASEDMMTEDLGMEALSDNEFVPLVNFTDGKVKVTYLFEAPEVPDMSTLEGMEGMEGMEGLGDLSMFFDPTELFNITMSVTLPNDASDHNGELVESNKVDWLLDFSGQIDMDPNGDGITEFYAESSFE